MNPTQPTPGDDLASIARSGSQLAEQSLQAGRRALHNGADQLAQAADDARAQGSSALRHLVDGTEDLAQQGWNSVRSRSLQAREATTHYVQAHPVASVLMAAAAGAALVGLAALFTRHPGGGR